MPAPASTDKREQFIRALGKGSSQAAAARMLGIHVNTAYKWAKEFRAGDGDSRDKMAYRARMRILEAEGLNRPRTRDELCDQALQALEDFAYFRLRYFGRATPGWGREAAQTVQDALRSPDRTYTVINIFPGVGKTTLLHDLAAWGTALDRSIRGLFGSAISSTAIRQCNQLKRTLERTYIYQPNDHDRRMGATDAEATLAGDFGLFRTNDVWRQNEFIVLQEGNKSLESKEPSWSAVGMDTEFLGNRFDLIFWDDLVTEKTIATMEAIEKQRTWWQSTAERRLEPGGALFLVGQRMGADDLYRFCLDKIVEPDDDEEDSEADEVERMYSHIVFRAHDEEKCDGQHRTPYPDGCMLDPLRFTRKDMRKARADERSWAIQFQQEDADPLDVLVRKVWVNGGRDPQTGEMFKGCWDDRDVWEVPDKRGIVYATVDTSPMMYWAIQVWLWKPTENLTYLLDTIKKKVTQPEFLYQQTDGSLTGIMVDWQDQSSALNMPIGYWIVEAGAAASGHWLITHPHMDAFRRRYPNVTILAHHTTGANKSNSDYGVPMLQPWWKSGSVRLPGYAKERVRPLVDESCRWPNAGLEDQVMAHWFGVHNHKNMRPRVTTAVAQRRPSWLVKSA